MKEKGSRGDRKEEKKVNALRFQLRDIGKHSQIDHQNESASESHRRRDAGKKRNGDQQDPERLRLYHH